MEVKYNVTGERRKALVKVISDITGARAVYQYMPTCNYIVDFFTITKDGTLVFDDRSDTEDVENVLEGIAAAGFECEAADGADNGDTAAFDGDAEELPTEPQEAADGADSGDVAAFDENVEELPADPQEAAQAADSGDTAASAGDAEELPAGPQETADGADSGDTAAFDEDAEELPAEAQEAADSGDTAAFNEEAKELPAEPETATQGETGGDTGLTISLPLDGFDADSLDRLRKLVDSKATLMKKALGADRLDIFAEGNFGEPQGKISFPWWDRLPEPEETRAFTAFIAALGTMAKKSKRVTATEKDVESEKYAFRGFLLRLGFIGADSKEERRLLLKNLSGTSAFPNREKADAFSAAQKAKRDAAKAAANGAAASAPEENGTEESDERDGEVTA